MLLYFPIGIKLTLGGGVLTFTLIYTLGTDGTEHVRDARPGPATETLFDPGVARRDGRVVGDVEVDQQRRAIVLRRVPRR